MKQLYCLRNAQELLTTSVRSVSYCPDGADAHSGLQINTSWKEGLSDQINSTKCITKVSYWRSIHKVVIDRRVQGLQTVKQSWSSQEPTEWRMHFLSWPLWRTVVGAIIDRSCNSIPDLLTGAGAAEDTAFRSIRDTHHDSRQHSPLF